jgi:hypothetical protein
VTDYRFTLADHHMPLGRLLVERGNAREAEACFLEIRRLCPENAARLLRVARELRGLAEEVVCGPFSGTDRSDRLRLIALGSQVDNEIANLTWHPETGHR